MARLLSVREPILAGEDERSEIASIQRALLGEAPNGPHLVGPDGEVMILPESLRRVLLEAAQQLGRGNGVALLSYEHELTTDQAAEILNVSRPQLVGLLDAQTIPFHGVGADRRVALRDLLAYRRERDALRQRSLHAMVGEAQELGLYDA